jgi:signal peptidase I
VEKEEIKEPRVNRLCGMQGDTVEIKNGFLYINGDSADQQLALSQEYYISTESLPQIEEAGYLDDASPIMRSPDSMAVHLSEKFVKEKDIKARRIILEKTYVDESIKATYGADWNQDNFGPVVVPDGNFFLLGDNRHLSEDSRYIGFIHQSAFIGTVLWRR